MRSFVLGFFVVLSLLLSIHYVIITKYDFIGHKGSSNFFSSVARLEKAVDSSQAKIVVCGSSLVGRFPPDPQVMNLGVDGGNTAKSLKALFSGKFVIPKIICLEANLISSGVNEVEESLMQEYLNSPLFNIRSKLLPLNAKSRPTDIVYSKLRSWVKSESVSQTSLVVDENYTIEQITKNAYVEENQYEEELKYSSEFLTRLVQEGYYVILVWVPNGIGSGSNEASYKAYARELASRSEIGYIDFSDLEDKKAIFYTDGVHLDKASAKLVQDLLIKSLKNVSHP